MLVTGAGLIGTVTAREIERAGGRAVLLDIAPQEAAIRQVGFQGSVLAGDVADYDGLCRVIRDEGVTAVVHTAAVLSRGLQANPRLAVSVNIGGTVNVLEAARVLGLGRVVLAGSSTVTYASFALARELRLPSIPEDAPSSFVSARQTSFYAASKAAMEQFAAIYAERCGVSVVVLRFAAVLGHWDGAVGLPTEAVLALVAPALRGEHANLSDTLLTWGGIEEFVDARDCAGAALAALGTARPPQVVFNIAYPAPVTHADLVAAVRARFPALVVDGVPHDKGFAGYPVSRPALSDVQAAVDGLNFRAERTLQDAVDWIVEVERRRAVR